MRELLAKLSFGIEAKNLHKTEWPLISELIDEGIVRNGSVFKLENGFIAGSVDITRSGKGFLCPINKDSQDIVIARRDAAFLEQDDLVIGQKIKERGKTVARIVWLGQKALPYIVAYIEKTARKTVARNIKTLEIINIDAKQKALQPLPDGAILKLDSTTKRPVAVLGVLDDPKVDEQISMALFDRKEEFSKSALTEARSYGTEVDKSLYPNRLDLTNLPFVTIDPVDAKDFDDAIYYDVEKSTLWVAIADVSFYVTPYSTLDKEAYERGFSVYFPHKSLPMLPRELSENICSLKPNVYRLAYTFQITIDQTTLEVTNYERYESIIRSKRRYNYDEIDEFLNEAPPRDEVDENVFKWLLPFNELTQKIREKRLKKGLDFHNDEIRLTLDENHAIVNARIEKQTRSHQLIEDAMLLANKCAASYFEKGIFRIHEKPAPQKIRALVEDLESIGVRVKTFNDFHRLVEDVQAQTKDSPLAAFVDKLIIRSQKQARYASQNIGHFGLGFEKYSHFTSPIRRYADLILHRMLKLLAQDDEKTLMHTLKTIDAVCIQVSELEREAAKAEWDFLDRKFARWANDNLQKEFDAIVTDANIDAEYPSIAKITAPFYGPRIFIIDDYAPIFSNIKVRIESVDLLRARIYGRLVKRPTQALL